MNCDEATAFGNPTCAIIVSRNLLVGRDQHCRRRSGRSRLDGRRVVGEGVGTVVIDRASGAARARAALIGSVQKHGNDDDWLHVKNKITLSKRGDTFTYGKV